MIKINFRKMIVLRTSMVVFYLIFIALTTAFSPLTRMKESGRASIYIGRNCKRHYHQKETPLYSGKGIAPNYTWQEEAFEIEIIVKVPKETRASDIHYKVTPNSLDVRLKNMPRIDESSERILLDPNRKLRGRIVLDGTYWIISDPEVVVPDRNDDDASDDNDKNNMGQSYDEYREITVTIEKQIRTPKDEFDIIEYDWNGLYEDDAEVTYRKYDEPEELNVREYAASMGVDIDNIDTNLVDKSMFTSGLNLTKSSLENMKEAGLMTEVTQQQDGSEWITDEGGEQKPFSSMGRGISRDEVQSFKKENSIPFLDTDSPWQKSIPIDRAKDVAQILEKRKTAASSKNPTNAGKNSNAKKQEEIDPVDNLTVAKLREVLKSRGLKVSGNKKELQELLRSEIQSMLDSNDERSIQ
mmetsp:Transcript_26476/g.29697  ORF Transcript_26476/g.29697 Transcript_26476/m.29697 type:complete len:412 (+) Transcript_26476:79-1314(+)